MIGILSDAHGHLAAFEQGLALLERRGARRFIFLGDSVGYVPSWGVVDALYRRKDDFTFVLGNHEDALLHAPIGDRDSVYRYAALRPGLTEERRAFLTGWRRTSELRPACGDVLLVHGSPADPQNGYLYPDTPLDDLAVTQDFVFCGHSHRPFIRRTATTCFVNVGSCGLPRDDGRYGSVALFDETSGEVSILRYDIQRATGELLREAGDVHPSVIGLFLRRADHVFGEINE